MTVSNHRHRTPCNFGGSRRGGDTNGSCSRMRLLLGALYGLICLLVLLDVSHATWSPHLHPQYPQQQQSHHQDYSSHYRGGSTAVQPPPVGTLQQQYYDDPQQQPIQEAEPFFEPPKIHLKHVSMALRLTSEWNRRLSEGINKMKHWGRGRRLAFTQQQPQQLQQRLQQPEYPYGGYQEQVINPQAEQQQQSYGDTPVNVHPSRTWQPPIPFTKPNSEGGVDDDEDLTVFHAKTPYRAAAASTSTSSSPQPRGVGHWGPDLLDYLQQIVALLGANANGVEIPLAMIYMDRACSVETPRSNGVLSCPFCSPRTVHRLSLVALILALEATGSRTNPKIDFSDPEQSEVLLGRCQDSLDIPKEDLVQMIDWMRAALGDSGLMVTMDQMKRWSHQWESIFSNGGGSGSSNNNRLEQPSVPQAPQLTTQQYQQQPQP